MLLLGLGGGFLAAVVGFLMGAISYDQRFIYDMGGIWDAVALVGFLLMLGGVLVFLASLVAVVPLGLWRLARRLRRY